MLPSPSHSIFAKQNRLEPTPGKPLLKTDRTRLLSKQPPLRSQANHVKHRTNQSDDTNSKNDFGQQQLEVTRLTEVDPTSYSNTFDLGPPNVIDRSTSAPHDMGNGRRVQRQITAPPALTLDLEAVNNERQAVFERLTVGGKHSLWMAFVSMKLVLQLRQHAPNAQPDLKQTASHPRRRFVGYLAASSSPG